MTPPTGTGAAEPAHTSTSLKDCTPSGSLWISAGLAWIAALATAGLLVLIGTGIDGLHPMFTADAQGGPTGGLAGSESSGAGGLGVAASAVSPAVFIWMVVLAVVAAAAVAAGEWYSAWAASTAERRLRQAIVSRVFRRGPGASAGRSGQLLSLATHAVEKTANYRAAFLGPMLGAMSTPLLVLGLMALTVDAVTAGWLALLIVIVPLAVGGFQRLVKPIGARYRQSQGRLTAAFLEAVETLGTLVYSRAAHRTERRLADVGEAHRKTVMKMLAGNQLLIFVVDAAFSLAIVVAAASIAATRTYHDSITAGQAIAIVLMTVLVIGPVDVIGQFFYIGIAGRASQRQIADHLGAGPVADGATGMTTAGSGGSEAAVSGPVIRAPESIGGLELRQVTAGWTPGRPVLANAWLTVEPGQRVALVGPSGSGKSTVSALIQAHLLPESGNVMVDGLDTRTADPTHIRASLAVVEQAPYLFEGSIAENLRFALPDATDDQLWHALGVGGLIGEVRAMPAGLNSPVGAQGQYLSGGQAQRLAIARAALRNAPILILDEPTSQVGLAAEAHVLEALDRLAAGRTVLMIAHRPGAILRADRVVDIRNCQRGTRGQEARA